MKRTEVTVAAKIIGASDGAKALRATLHGGGYELRLYALSENQTMHDEIEIDPSLADVVIGHILAELESQLKNLGVTDT